MTEAEARRMRDWPRGVVMAARENLAERTADCEAAHS
jgi:hypothetical protein